MHQGSGGTLRRSRDRVGSFVGSLLLAAAACLLLVATAVAAPSNDDFAQASPLTLGSSAAGTTVGATKEAGEPDHAGEPGGHSVWFTWTPQASGPVILSTCEPFSELDSVLAVYTGSTLGALTPVGSNDDAMVPSLFPECRGTDSEVLLQAQAGTAYRIAVDGAGGTVGTYNLRLRGRPANDSFATPQLLDPSRQTNATGGQTTRLATKEAGEPDHAGDPGGHSVWFSWTPTEGSRVALRVCPRFNEPLESVAAVYTGSAVDDLTEVASSAGAAEPSCGTAGSEATWVAQAGTTYRIAVDGKHGTEGIFQLNLQPPAVNDEFADAKALSGTLPVGESGSTFGATVEAGEPAHAPDAEGHSVWFTWTAPSTGPVAITACPYAETGGDPVLAVYTGSALGGLTRVAADDAGGAYCSARASDVELEVTAGVEYKIAVDSAGGQRGFFSLGISGPPSNDDFAAPTQVAAEPTLVGGSTRWATKQPGEPDHAGEPGGHSVWFRWTPSRSGPISVTACRGREAILPVGGGIDPVLAVYTGESLGGLTPVAAADGTAVGQVLGCPGGEAEGASGVRFEAVAGTEYKIAVDGKDGGEGPFSLGFERGPANDEFAAATKLEGGLPVYGVVDNRFAGEEAGEPAIAGFHGGHSVWFKWTPQASGPFWISTCTTIGSLDTLLGVYTGEAVDGLTPVASSDDAAGADLRCRATDSGVEVDAVAGTTYRIAAAGKGGSIGEAQLLIEGAPADDDFVHAASLGASMPQLSIASNRFAGLEPGEPEIAGVPGAHSIWFKWTAPRSGEVSVDTCGSAIDTLLGVYAGGAVGSLTEVASDDDATGECSPGSRATFTATAGAAYRIAVDGKGGETGAIRLAIEGVPANDDFAGASRIRPEGEYANGSNALATEQGGEPGPGGHSVWYSWTPAVSGPASLEACGTGFVPEVGVYNGGALASLTAVPTDSSAAACAKGSTVDFTAVAGTTYRIAVGGSEGGSLVFRLLAPGSRLRLLTLRTGGTGSGSVSSSSNGIACGARCRYDFPSGTTLALVAEPAPGSDFVGWSGGGCGGVTGACTVDFHSDATVTAMFAPDSPAGEGPVDGTPAEEETSPVGQQPAPGSASPSTSSPAPAAAGTAPRGPLPKQTTRCRKGYKKKRVHGKDRCVKQKPKKHRGQPKRHR
jgi:hypothetical protein